MAGTNDVGHAYAKAKETKTPVDGAAVVAQMGDDMRKLVTKITTLRPDASVLVRSIIFARWA